MWFTETTADVTRKARYIIAIKSVQKSVSGNCNINADILMKSFSVPVHLNTGTTVAYMLDVCTS